MHPGLLEELCRINPQPWSIASCQESSFTCHQMGGKGEMLEDRLTENIEIVVESQRACKRTRDKRTTAPTIRRNNSLSVNIRMLEIKNDLFFVHGTSTSVSISNGRNSWKILSHLWPWTICFPPSLPLSSSLRRFSSIYHRILSSFTVWSSSSFSAF